MKFINIDMDLLRALVCVSDTRGFTQAAKKLFRTQSAISLQIKKLERLTDRQLVERGKEIRLTPAGLKVHEYALKILELNDELISSVANEHIPLRVRIGLPELHDQQLIEKMLDSIDSFNAQYSFLSDGSENLSNMVDCHLLDIAVLLRSEPNGEQAIGKIPMSWVSTRDSRLHLDNNVALALPAPGSAIRRAAQKALEDQGRHFSILCTAHDLIPLKAAIAAGKAIGVLPTGSVPCDLRILDSGELPALPQLHLCTKVSSQASPAVYKIAAHMTGILALGLTA
ncbi:LysR family transcriptional regulator [Pseudomonas vanderleydeniana]|uniref:LysR family transcriptional regulator n=1 Tax=Pseudomonas vanderleydeniana TaxID=2745495 RepID=A0A9E6PIT5_9PSED|nr:LysR family transcriptional regulator [Pseudomonas vanderleydeniana]QXI27274.1 LysR family transcriptional regulator [Pseudomonas vanderleydeniana]